VKEETSHKSENHKSVAFNCYPKLGTTGDNRSQQVKLKRSMDSAESWKDACGQRGVERKQDGWGCSRSSQAQIDDDV